MKIYFEDGELIDIVRKNIGAFQTCDGKYGFSQNQQALDWYKKWYEGHSVVIYTNSLVALSNEYCWNDEFKVPELYIRPSKSADFVRVDKLTNKILREGHNLRRMYMANAFGNLGR